MITSGRFWPKVAQSGSPEVCWLWTGAKGSSGHGQIWDGNRLVGAHRVAYELCVGQIPPGLEVWHTCDNPPCCNPFHLFVDTHKGNMEDMRRKGRHRTGDHSGRHNHFAKLNETQVIEIRRLNSEEGLSCRRIARSLGVARTTIQDILAGRSWAHLP